MIAASKTDLGLVSAIAGGLFLTTLAFQLGVSRYRPVIYWSVSAAAAALGTLIPIYLFTAFGLSLLTTSLLAGCAMLAVCILWDATMGFVSVSGITRLPAELFYWATVLIASFLGSSLGYYTSSHFVSGIGGAAFVFGAALALIAFIYSVLNYSGPFLFWATFTLTFPLGDTVDDLLTPIGKGSSALDKGPALAVVAIAIFAAICLSSRVSATRETTS